MILMKMSSPGVSECLIYPVVIRTFFRTVRAPVGKQKSSPCESNERATLIGLI